MKTPKTKTDVVVCKTNRGNLILRSNPTNTEVRKFVKEHHRRFKDGEPGGPDGSFAHEIKAATRYPSEADFLSGVVGESVKIEDIISS